MTSLADLEARVAALEADRADYRAVLSAVGALGQRVDGLTTEVGRIDERLNNVEVKTDANREAINALSEKLAGRQQETREEFASVRSELALLRNDLADHRQESRAGFRSVDEHLAQTRDLIVNGRGRGAE
jgi:chromosome segregation ATPase